MGFPTSRRWGSFSPLFLFIWVLCNGGNYVRYYGRICKYLCKIRKDGSFYFHIVAADVGARWIWRTILSEPLTYAFQLSSTLSSVVSVLSL
ncbi:Uncharacterized protein TCM_005170 isoform 1 [Theobroma cacao]|uniref:Uncharacterized protein isoform 1 n=2 Tax=Theobroma cacao TaxID=3641 RepID=A0A061DTP0_THECC|nr:Uncharacterized protein TCM_005170 isoform 1 [Theobroma cacao]